MAEDKIIPRDTKPEELPVLQQGPDPKEQKAIKAFFDEFIILSKKHGYDIGARLDASDPTALRAVPMIVKLRVPEEAKPEDKIKADESK